MDAVKIIKKHGSPGGLPVITAYVADNAPGESEIKINVANPPSLELLENIQYKGQTYQVPETPWIPTPTVGSAGKVLGVSDSGTYELQTPSGGGGGVFEIGLSFSGNRVYTNKTAAECIAAANAGKVLVIKTGNISSTYQKYNNLYALVAGIDLVIPDGSSGYLKFVANTTNTTFVTMSAGGGDSYYSKTETGGN